MFEMLYNSELPWNVGQLSQIFGWSVLNTSRN